MSTMCTWRAGMHTAVENHVRTPLERVLERGRGESRVDQQVTAHRVNLISIILDISIHLKSINNSSRITTSILTWPLRLG